MGTGAGGDGAEKPGIEGREYGVYGGE